MYLAKLKLPKLTSIKKINLKKKFPSYILQKRLNQENSTPQNILVRDKCITQKEINKEKKGN